MNAASIWDDEVAKLLRSGRYTSKAIARDTGLHYETVRACACGFSYPTQATIDKLRQWFIEHGPL